MATILNRQLLRGERTTNQWVVENSEKLKGVTVIVEIWHPDVLTEAAKNAIAPIRFPIGARIELSREKSGKTRKITLRDPIYSLEPLEVADFNSKIELFSALRERGYSYGKIGRLMGSSAQAVHSMFAALCA